MSKIPKVSQKLCVFFSFLVRICNIVSLVLQTENGAYKAGAYPIACFHTQPLSKLEITQCIQRYQAWVKIGIFLHQALLLLGLGRINTVAHTWLIQACLLLLHTL
jgi:hypothetical protein